MLNLKQWKEENSEWYEPGDSSNEVTPVPAAKFIRKISAPDVVFVNEGAEYTSGRRGTRYVMYDSAERADYSGSKRITNIDVYPDDRTVTYEGRRSLWHEVVGNDSDYDTIVNILDRKTYIPPYMQNTDSVYSSMNKIDDSESLSEKYNVKNVKEFKKLQESQKADNYFVYNIGSYDPNMFIDVIWVFDTYEDNRTEFIKFLEEILAGKHTDDVQYPIAVRGEWYRAGRSSWGVKLQNDSELRTFIRSLRNGKYAEGNPQEYEFEEDSNVVYAVGYYDEDKSFFEGMYVIDTPEEFSSTRENFADILKAILNGDPMYSSNVSYPFVVREEIGGIEEVIKNKRDLRKVIKEIEEGMWE